MQLPRVASLIRGLKVMREAHGCLGRESRWRKKERKSKDIQREGTYIYPWLIPVVVRQKSTKFCKAIILQIKNK